MEQGRYWMWAKAKPAPDLSPRLLTPSAAMNSFGDSWEEQAFAEDAAGALGGCVWPPRSYSCSFCRREFRSAQALGGHMNVHRRDRARLKQSSNSPPEVVPHALNTCTSYDSCTFLYSNPNPNPDQFSDTGALAPVSPLIRVSSPRSNSDQDKISTGLSFFPPLVLKNGRDSDAVSPQPPSWSSFLSEKRSRPAEKGPEGVEPESSRVEKEDCVTEDLSKGLNLAQNSDEEVASCKRRRIEAKEPLISLPNLSLIDRCVRQSEVAKLSVAIATEELDLELRLGNAPKVK